MLNKIKNLTPEIILIIGLLLLCITSFFINKIIGLFVISSVLIILSIIMFKFRE